MGDRAMPRILLASQLRFVATTRGKPEIIGDSVGRVLVFLPAILDLKKSESVNKGQRLMVEIAGNPCTKIQSTTDCNRLAIAEP